MLSHRADVIILGSIVVEVVVMERIGFVARTLFEMEAVVFDVSLHTGLVHETLHRHLLLPAHKLYLPACAYPKILVPTISH